MILYGEKSNMAKLNVTPNSFDFGKIKIGEISDAGTVLLENLTSDPLTVTLTAPDGFWLKDPVTSVLVKTLTITIEDIFYTITTNDGLDLTDNLGNLLVYN